jgi:ligand-binding sensor domain-containing protein/DNA-binding CsgD family transcriptional regulator
MKKELVHLLLVLMWLTCGGALLQGKQKTFEFERISVEEGLSQSTVTCILQDGKGFMWFGTYNGLNKYDGHSMTVYRNDSGARNSLSEDAVLSLCQTPDSMIWIGTMQGGLNRFDPRTGVFTRFQPNPGGDPAATVNSPQIQGLRVDKNGHLWIATFGGGLNKFDPETNRFTHYLFKKGDAGYPLVWRRNAVRSFTGPHDGVFWAGTHDGLIRFEPEGEKIKVYQPEPGKPGAISHMVVTSVLVTRGGTLWAGTFDGLNRYNPGADTFTVFRNDPSDPYSISHSRIQTLFEDRSGVIRIATNAGGVDYFNAEEQRFYHSSHHSGDIVRSIYQSKDGILWFGTMAGGVNKLDLLKCKMACYRQDPGKPFGLSDGSVSCIYEDREGVLWLGTETGGLNRMDRQTGYVTVYKHRPGDPAGLRNNMITGLVEGKKGYLWLSTHKGLHRFDRKTGAFTHYPADYDNPRAFISDEMFDIALDPSGRLWVAIPGAGVNLFDPETGLVTPYRAAGDNPSGLSHDWVNMLYIDRRGTLWAGTSKGGLNRFNSETNTFSHYQASISDPHSISDNDVNDIHEGGQGNFWIATAGGGLNRMDRETGTFTCYTTRDGLADDVVYAVLEDGNGLVWLSTNRGISRFDPRTGVFKNYDLRDGLQGYEFRLGAAFKNQRGELFFGGLRGLNVFHPDNMRDNRNIPDIVITSLKRFNQPVPVGANSSLKKHISYTNRLTLPHDKNFFSLEFAALDYTNPANNRYRYKLEGMHDDWIPLGNKHDINFTGLKPGEYRFRVMGSNNDGYWNEAGTVLDITVTPPYWATWWFRGLVLLAIAGLILLWHRNRMNRATLELKTESQLNRLFAKYGISEREQDVLRLALKGKSNNEIEDQLYISLPTVKKHLYNVYKKMAVKNRLELINLVQRSMPGSARLPVT